MKTGIVITDTHLGLQTDEISRTEEIIHVMLHAVKYAVKVKADFVVLGGDSFDNNTPNEHLIAQFIRVLNILRKAGIKVFIMVGNHEVIANHERKSCLSFLRKMKGGYPNVKLIDDVKTIKMFKAEVGDIYFTFLPYVTKSHIKSGYKTVQKYMDIKAKGIRSDMPEHAQHFVFSHLNVPDCIPGSEKDMLKKIDVVVPKAFRQFRPGKNYPTIIQGHVHTRQRVGNIHVVGSPVFVDFGEKEQDKYFLKMRIAEWLGEGPGGMEYIKTECAKMVEVGVGLKEGKKGLVDQVKAQWPVTHTYGEDPDEVRPEDTILKVNVTISEDYRAMVDFHGARQELLKNFYYVKPIQPRILRKRVKRNRKQTTKLAPLDAVRLWLSTHKPKNKKRILKLASDYVEVM